MKVRMYLSDPLLTLEENVDFLKLKKKMTTVVAVAKEEPTETSLEVTNALGMRSKCIDSWLLREREREREKLVQTIRNDDDDITRIVSSFLLLVAGKLSSAWQVSKQM